MSVGDWATRDEDLTSAELETANGAPLKHVTLGNNPWYCDCGRRYVLQVRPLPCLRIN